MGLYIHTCTCYCNQTEFHHPRHKFNFAKRFSSMLQQKFSINYYSNFIVSNCLHYEHFAQIKWMEKNSNTTTIITIDKQLCMKKHLPILNRQNNSFLLRSNGYLIPYAFRNILLYYMTNNIVYMFYVWKTFVSFFKHILLWFCQQIYTIIQNGYTLCAKFSAFTDQLILHIYIDVLLPLYHHWST